MEHPDWKTSRPLLPERGLVRALVAVGVVARLVRYAARFPLWEAEAYAAATLVGRGFAELARPLDYQTVCPLGFLWVEWLAVRLLGCSESVLRLFPLICGISSVLLFAWVSGRILSGSARVLSVGLLSASYQLIRNSAEARQYASDLFFAIMLIALCVGYLTAQAGRRMRWWVGLMTVVPFALFFSLPAVFVAAGATLAVGWSGVGRDSEDSDGPFNKPRSLARGLLPAATLAVLLFASFAVLCVVSLWPLYRAARSAGALALMWKDAFPPLAHPVRLALWLLETHTGRMFAYVTGGPDFRSVFTAIFFLLGLAEMWRRRRTALLLLLTTPFVTGLLAAVPHFYPYGATDRLVTYLAPSICLMAGLGAATLVERLPTVNARRLALFGATLGLAAFGLAVAADSLARPYKAIEEARERRFARSFWTRMADGAEVASLKADLHVELEPEVWLWSDTGFRAAFYYYRAAYGPPEWHPDDPRWRLLSPAHPLRAVVWTSREDGTPPSEASWLASISNGYRLVRKQTLSVNPRSFYLVYELAPVAAAPAALAPFSPGRADRPLLQNETVDPALSRRVDRDRPDMHSVGLVEPPLLIEDRVRTLDREVELLPDSPNRRLDLFPARRSAGMAPGRDDLVEPLELKLQPSLGIPSVGEGQVVGIAPKEHVLAVRRRV